MNFKDEFCYMKECNRAIRSRGLCNLHRTEAGRKVRSGQTTWEELEELGLAKPLMSKAERDIRKMHKHLSPRRKMELEFQRINRLERSAKEEKLTKF